MSRQKEPTLFRVKLLKNTAYNYAGDILNIKAVDDDGSVYYYDSFHRWCYLESNAGWWKRLPDKPINHRSGIWILPEDEMPEMSDEEGIEKSKVVLIRGNDNCVWLAYWDGEVWHNVNSSDIIYFQKSYVIEWMKIPTSQRILK